MLTFQILIHNFQLTVLQETMALGSSSPGASALEDLADWQQVGGRQLWTVVAPALLALLEAQPITPWSRNFYATD